MSITKVHWPNESIDMSARGKQRRVGTHSHRNLTLTLIILARMMSFRSPSITSGDRVRNKGVFARLGDYI